MAKLNIMGDTIQLTSDLTRAEIERVKAFAPDALKLFDNEGNEIYRIDLGSASISKYGVCFCSEDAGGKVFMTTNNPITDHSDPEKEKEEIIKFFATDLHKLNAVEANVASAKETLEGIEADVTDSVAFVG